MTAENAKKNRGILVVGELNPLGTDPLLALYPWPRRASGDRLRSIMGLTDVAYLKFLDRTNLCTGRWSSALASERAWEIVEKSNHEVVVLLGARVRAAFRGPRPFNTWRNLNSTLTLASLPHPSGLCRTWNNPAATSRARDFLAKVAPWVPWGMTDREAELRTVGPANVEATP